MQTNPLRHIDRAPEADLATSDTLVNRAHLRVVSPCATSTPSTAQEGVGQFDWQMEAGLDRNSRAVGQILASRELGLFAHADGGLLQVENDRVRHITSAKELLPLLIDNVRVRVTKNGKFSAEKPGADVLNAMLKSRSFLDRFPTVKHVVTTPIVLPNYHFSAPGYNDGGFLHVGPRVSIGEGLEHINKFLEVMEFQAAADRTNAVAAMLTVPFRYHFIGGKPMTTLLGNKSHSGKGTAAEFTRGRCPKAQVNYQDKDWPMEMHLYQQLVDHPEIGIIEFDNVRTDSSGGGRTIRSAFLESFLTSPEVVINSTRGNRPIRVGNHFVVVLNTNHGALSPDLLNRCLPIRLCPKGDLSERISRARRMLGGDIKQQWLPANRDRIEAEMWGMIARWIAAGRPLDEKVQYPMAPWAQTIGGILMVNRFSDFLANYEPNKTSADPVREALGILAWHAGGSYKRAGELAAVAVREGLAPVLLPGTNSSNEAARVRKMGVTLGPYVDDTVTAVTPEEQITYRLKKAQGRFGEEHPHFRYRFEEIGRTDAGDNYGGPIVERGCHDTAETVLAEYGAAVQP